MYDLGCQLYSLHDHHLKKDSTFSLCSKYFQSSPPLFLVVVVVIFPIYFFIYFFMKNFWRFHLTLFKVYGPYSVILFENIFVVSLLGLITCLTYLSILR